MSKIIKNTRQNYILALKKESLLIIIIAAVTLIWNINVGISTLVGMLAAFVPHIMFTLWIFFCSRQQKFTQMKTFYQGEILKWFCAITLITSAFIWYDSMNIIAFFVGFLTVLLLNNLLIMLYSTKKRNF